MSWDEQRVDGTEKPVHEKIMIFDLEKALAYLYAGWRIVRRTDVTALWLERNGQSKGLNLGWNVMNDFKAKGWLEEHAEYPRGHYLMKEWSLNDMGKIAYEKSYKNKHDKLKAEVQETETKVTKDRAPEPEWYTLQPLNATQVLVTFLLPNGLELMMERLGGKETPKADKPTKSKSFTCLNCGEVFTKIRVSTKNPSLYCKKPLCKKAKAKITNERYWRNKIEKELAKRTAK
jgi:hypothetical protein